MFAHLILFRQAKGEIGADYDQSIMFQSNFTTRMPFLSSRFPNLEKPEQIMPARLFNTKEIEDEYQKYIIEKNQEESESNFDEISTASHSNNCFKIDDDKFNKLNQRKT